MFNTSQIPRTMTWAQGPGQASISSFCPRKVLRQSISWAWVSYVLAPKLFYSGRKARSWGFASVLFRVFFFLVVVVLHVRYANAEPTFLKAGALTSGWHWERGWPRSQCHPLVKAPSDEQEWQELMFFACFISARTCALALYNIYTLHCF